MNLASRELHLVELNNKSLVDSITHSPVADRDGTKQKTPSSLRIVLAISKNIVRESESIDKIKSPLK